MSDLQVSESYEEFRLRTINEKPVTLNEIVKQMQREKREAELKEDLLVLEAILKAFVLVSSLVLSVFILIDLLAGA